MTKEMLYRFFNGLSLPHEADEVAAYLAGDDQTVLNEYIDWLAARETASSTMLSPEESASIFAGIKKTERSGEETPVITIRSKRWTRWRIVASVAAALLIIAVTVYVFQNNDLKKQPQQTAWVALANTTDQVKTIRMPDGTQIWLNRQSSLQYDQAAYNKTSRLVKIDGEVFFDVAHNPEKPFLVQTGAVTTRVLGTAFNIEAYDNENRTRVTLVRGKLQINADANHFILSPGQMMTYDHQKQTMDVKNVKTINTAGWINGALVFNDVALTDVFKRLEQTYHITIHYSTAELTAPRYLTGSFANNNAETVLKKILFIYGLHYSRTGDNYMIKP